MPPGPITAHPPRAVRTALSSQVWQDVAFLHWPCDPQLVRPLLPPGTEPDVFDGVTWLGVVGLRMARVSLAALPPLPYLGDFLETNVRGYAVDREGRRGTVFLTMEASRLPFVLNARVAARLPYAWSWMGLRRDRDRLDYRLTRHWPHPIGASMRWRLRVGEAVTPSPLEHFVTARWGQHSRWYGATIHTPVEHEPWPLRAAELLDFDEDGLFAAAGLPVPTDPPSSVLYAPTVHPRFGLPAPTC